MGNAHLSGKKSDEITFNIDDKKFAVNIGEILIEVDDTKPKQLTENSTTSIKLTNGIITSGSYSFKEEIEHPPPNLLFKLLAENNYYRQPNINCRPSMILALLMEGLDNLEDKFMIFSYGKKLKLVINLMMNLGFF